MKIGIWIVYIINTLTSISGTNFCKNSENQLCRMMCPEITCPDGQCAMRNGNCCGYNCIDINSCPETCPVFQCPMPDIREMNNCRSIDPEIDNCGCPTGCQVVNCEPNRMNLDVYKKVHKFYNLCLSKKCTNPSEFPATM